MAKRHGPPRPPPRPAAAADGDDDADRDAWARAVSDVQPLDDPRRAGGRARRKPPPPVPLAPPPPPEDFAALLAASEPFDVRRDGASIEGRGTDVDVRLLRDLKGGAIRIEERIDLHGATRERAVRALVAFVRQARAAGRRAVLVIHGRGAGSEGGTAVLRRAVHEWLASDEAAADVLAFASAPPRDGGTGATRVLLRRANRRGSR